MKGQQYLYFETCLSPDIPGVIVDRMNTLLVILLIRTHIMADFYLKSDSLFIYISDMIKIMKGYQGDVSEFSKTL